jgi:hypothetical protein
VRAEELHPMGKGYGVPGSRRRKAAYGAPQIFVRACKSVVRDTCPFGLH